MKKLLILFLLFAPSLFAQDENPVYVIRGIHYAIDGKTKESALERVCGFKTGIGFAGMDPLEKYIAEKTQDLRNIRALDENASTISYSLGEAEEDGAVPVYLEVSAADSRNLVILPEPKYDSNSGFSLSLKTRMYNFLGTLAPQKFDFVWEKDEKNRNSLGFLIDFEFPFKAFGFNWTFTSYNEFKGYLSGDPHYDINVLGIAMELPVLFTAFTFGFEQGIVVHEENTPKIQAFEGTTEEYHSWYFSSKLYTDWEIPTPLRVGAFGNVTYTPGLYFLAKYKGGSDIGDYRHGPSLGIKQDIGFGKINWIGNYRNGLSVSLYNGNEYNFYHHAWYVNLGFAVEGHLRITNWFGVSGRLMYTKWFNDYYEYAGDVIRGFKDDALNAKGIMSLNMDFPFRVLRFVPSEWTGNRKWRYFDFELHVSLFADFVMAESKDGSYNFKPSDIIPGLGFEVIVFPLTWRSFFLRGSIGWDIREASRIGKLPSGIHREIYVGLGHYY